nr:MAG TPA: hypothetical protein [Caudoviricetes sp.]
MDGQSIYTRLCFLNSETIPATIEISINPPMTGTASKSWINEKVITLIALHIDCSTDNIYSTPFFEFFAYYITMGYDCQ